MGGAGLPVTSPGVNLPGAEYFALQPNRSIALGPRIAINTSASAATAVPAGGNAFAQQSLTLVPTWTTSMGIWFVRAYVLFIPGDTTGELSITGARLGLGPPPLPNIFIDIGTPLSTFAAPIIPQIAILDRDFLVTGLDLFPAAFPLQGPLNLYGQVACHNADATNPHSFQIQMTAVFHLPQGFVQ